MKKLVTNKMLKVGLSSLKSCAGWNHEPRIPKNLK